VSDACNWRFTETPYNVDDLEKNNPLLFDPCAFIQRLDRPGGRRIAGHKDQESFRAIAHTESQTPKEESDTNSVARDFAETKESFSESIANRDAEKQIKAQKNNSDANARARRKSICDSIRNAGVFNA